jgi:4-hydroxy-tetrahydrodipicolinate reductase
MTKVCIAGATGWAGSLVAKTILHSNEFKLVGAIARKSVGKDVGEVLGVDSAGLQIEATLDRALSAKPDVLIDYTKPDSVKERTLSALANGVHVVIGTSGLSATDYIELENQAKRFKKGVIACGNFSVTAALAKRFALMAAEHLPSWEVIDYAHAGKVDAPSGTTRELAEQLLEIRKNKLELPLEKTIGHRDARGATIGETQVHSVRLPSFVISFETIFGQPHERLSIRHDSGTGAEPYVSGTLLAVKKIVGTVGLIRGLDTLMFGPIKTSARA